MNKKDQRDRSGVKQQRPISSFFSKSFPSSKPKTKFTPQKLELTRSNSVLSTISSTNEFDDISSSDTSYDSIEVSNFSTPALSRSFNSNRLARNSHFKSVNILPDNDDVQEIAAPVSHTAVKKERSSQQRTVEPLKRTNTAGLFDLLSGGQPRKVPRLGSPSSFSTEESKQPAASLSEEQLKVIYSVVNDKLNVFFTGSAGTGKSVVLRELVKKLRNLYRDNVGLTASTGMAACNIGGQTLHKFLGIGLGSGTVAEMFKRINKNSFQLQKWRSLKVLIIDEISMIDGDLFEKLNSLAKQLRGNDKPFGGIQVVCTGDFFQLPPIVKSGAEPKFCFDTDAWKNVISKTIVLTKVFRQKGDNELIDMLNAIRCGKIDTEIEQKFLKLARKVNYDDGIEPTELYPTRYEVKQANMSRLSQLKSQPVIYRAKDQVANEMEKKQLDSLMCEESLELKEGAQVMCLINYSNDIVNGSVGTVLFFTEYKVWEKTIELYGIPDLSNPQILEEMRLVSSRIGKTDAWNAQQTITYNRIPDERRLKFDKLCQVASRQSVLELYPVVNFKIRGSDIPLFVDRHEFSIDKGRSAGVSSDASSQKLVREQLPLLLSWAMSIHKAQGQTIDRLKVDLKKVFEKGQVYVAISRATNKDHLEIRNFHPSKVTVSSSVQDFYNRINV